MRPRSVYIWLLAIFQLWLAHAIGFMVHEYAHSLTAWSLHGMANPFALDYGHVNLDNILFQQDIDENVDYASLFAAGRGHAAALIAVAGVLFGNGLSYIMSRLGLRKATEKGSRAWAMFFFWLCVMSVGNFLAYVPIRTFTWHADMANVAKGLNISPWVIALGLGIPFAIAIYHFFARLLPAARAYLFPSEPVLQGVLVLMTTYFVFVLFGTSGIRNYGAISHALSTISEFILFPIATILCLQRQSPGT